MGKTDKLVDALREIADFDCGCVPCTGQCRKGEAAEYELEARMEIAREALAEYDAQPAHAAQPVMTVNHVSSAEHDLPIGMKLYAEPQAQPVGVPDASFQSRVSVWFRACFTPSVCNNMTERGDRLLEEVLELLQSKGYDRNRVATLVDYVWGRPVGEPAQEVGGVMVTLAAFCHVAELDMHAAGEAELARINRPEVIAKIRKKQEAKNALNFDTPLPGLAAAPQPPAQPSADAEELRILRAEIELMGRDDAHPHARTVAAMLMGRVQMQLAARAAEGDGNGE